MDKTVSIGAEDFIGISEIGYGPWTLYLFYLIHGGVQPPLLTVAQTFGVSKSAVCQLRNKLFDAGWITEDENGFLTFRKTKPDLEKLNASSLNINNNTENKNKETPTPKKKLKVSFANLDAKTASVLKFPLPNEYPIKQQHRDWIDSKVPVIKNLKFIDIQLQTAKFEVYWHDKSHLAKGKKTGDGWFRAWCNWMLKAAEWYVPSNTPQNRAVDSDSTISFAERSRIRNSYTPDLTHRPPKGN